MDHILPLSNPPRSLSHIHFFDKSTLLQTPYGSRFKYFNTRIALPFEKEWISSKYVISHPFISKNQWMSFINVKTFIHFQVNAPSLASRLMDKPSSCDKE